MEVIISSDGKDGEFSSCLALNFLLLMMEMSGI